MPFRKTFADRLGDRKKALDAAPKPTLRVGTKARPEPPKETELDAQGAANGAPVPESAGTGARPAEASKPSEVSAPVISYGAAKVPLLRDDSDALFNPSAALAWLVETYLTAARDRSRHIALLWPCAPKTQVLVHALATLERWAAGDKLGVRGLAYPAKTNVFHPLNHIRLEHRALHRLVEKFQESSANPLVTRSHPRKDAYLFSFNSHLKGLDATTLNPTVGELLPQFFADASNKNWPPAHGKLLSQITAKLLDPDQVRALRAHCVDIGQPAKAPDALFALDGRMTSNDLKRMLIQLKKVGPPEVVLINATRSIRRQATGWKGALVRFCMQLEEVFGASAPGVVIVTDEPHAAYRLREELEAQNIKRPPAQRWAMGKGYAIDARPSASHEDGLLEVGKPDLRVPAPRVIDVQVVDAKAAKVGSSFYQIANDVPGGRPAAQPLLAAAQFLGKTAALPCGRRDVREWLEEIGADDVLRSSLNWTHHLGELSVFERSGDAGAHQRLLAACLKTTTEMVNDYDEQTPFAVMLADHVGHAMANRKDTLLVVFTSQFHLRLATRFLARYKEFSDGAAYSSFADRITMVTTRELDAALDQHRKAQLVFAGLDEEALRILVTDDRVPKHSALLLTQQNGQYLRAALQPLVSNFPHFRPLKPRMESMLRGLTGLPNNQALLSQTDLKLPSFRRELETVITSAQNESADPEAWEVRLSDGPTLYRRPGHRMYVYDPASRERQMNRGFRACSVKDLKPGDLVVHMSAELRDMVDAAFKGAGIQTQRDLKFEQALRGYHSTVMELLADKYPTGTLTQKVRALRADILAANPGWEQDFPEEQAVRAWVNLGRSEDTAYENLRPQAPMKEAHFSAFSRAIGMSPLEARMSWRHVIEPMRSARRVDGRNLADTFTHMLLQPESVEVHKKLPRSALKQLFDQARHCVYPVENITARQGQGAACPQ